MLNRTNRTLSALALSDRLDLGTRSLAANASVNRGDQTLLVRQTHHGVMRDGMKWFLLFPMPRSASAIPSIPGSISQVWPCQLSCLTEQQGLVAVDVRVEPEPRPADLVGRPEPSAAAGILRLKRSARQAAGKPAAVRSATSGK